MCLRHISHSVLQISVLQVIFVALLIVFIRGITYPMSRCAYNRTSKVDTEKLLYDVRNPNLIINTSLPRCQYDFINDNNNIEKEDIDSCIARFKLDGLVNGSFAPTYCNPVYSTAILVIYRHGKHQLLKFIQYIHNFLKKQDIHYKMYLIEQRDEESLNAGLLYNVGALTAVSDGYPCLIFHDMDLLPLDMANIYVCMHLPKQMVSGADDGRYHAGGVLVMQAEQFQEVNGFSNRPELWWSDDFADRLAAKLLPVIRYPQESHYAVLFTSTDKPTNTAPSPRSPPPPQPYSYSSSDGLDTASYKVDVELNRLYTTLAVKTLRLN